VHFCWVALHQLLTHGQRLRFIRVQSQKLVLCHQLDSGHWTRSSLVPDASPAVSHLTTAQWCCFPRSWRPACQANSFHSGPCTAHWPQDQKRTEQATSLGTFVIPIFCAIFHKIIFDYTRAMQPTNTQVSHG